MWEFVTTMGATTAATGTALVRKRFSHGFGRILANMRRVSVAPSDIV